MELVAVLRRLGPGVDPPGMEQRKGGGGPGFSWKDEKGMSGVVVAETPGRTTLRLDGLGLLGLEELNYIRCAYITNWMAPKGQPPSLKQSNTTEPTTDSPLAITIHKLHNLLFKIALPKTKNAKTAAIAVDTLRLTQDLATSACTTIMPHLGIPSAAQLPQKCSYASVLATGVQLPVLVSSQNLPCPVTHFDFTLTQKS